ncbi:MAG: hypothetical protein SRB2_02553 [Desulfobacteraceae bacterium Eth-SRB2]|nr:MAG: hypothetical protein SRB2_02553 [Desulfobacteraceae bacterium Eth-SRB2]
MKRKIFFMVLGVLGLYVVIHIIIIRKGNIANVNTQISMIEHRLQENKSLKRKLMQEKEDIETTLVSVPENILEGFEDPEREFVDFMDYINDSNLKKMQSSIAIPQMQTYKERPVPLQESRFEFNFKIKSTQELEEFLDYLMIKGKYPLSVQQLEITRIPQQYPHVFLEVALLLPAKIDLPKLTKSDKEAS